MIGTFCHRIIEELYANAAHLDVEDAYQKAGRLYDELIDSMASELLLEGRAAERHRTKAAVTQAVRQLVASINDLNLSVEKTEALLQGECNGIPFKGFADMQLSDSKGNRFVLDFKWSSSAKYKKQEFEEGAALQPAAYAHMVRAQEPSRRVYAGYFMLAQGKLLSDSPLLSDDAIKSPIDLDEVWRRGVAGVSAVLESFEDGTVVARGIAEEEKSRELGVTREKAMESIKAQNWEKGLLYQEPPCRYCDFNRLCGY
jgi:RecB family exonuclease